MKPDLNLLVFIFSSIQVSLLLEYCPPRCRCDWSIYSVSCFGAEVMPFFHSSTQEVSLVGTKLSSIPQNAFVNLANLSRIYISDDDTIRYLERHSFHNLSRVTHIQLTGIKTLSHIDQEAFKDLPNLKYLGITNTGLTSFPGLQYIQSSQEDFILEIVENVFIQVIPANSFTGISENALTIMLNSNGVREIQHYAFNGSRLEEVYLHRNMDLERIDEFAFYGVIQGPTHLHSEAVICNLTRAALGKLQESSAALSQKHLRHKIYQHVNDSFGLPTADGRNHNHYNDTSVCPTEQSQNEFYVELPTERLSEGFDFALCDELRSDNRGLLCTPLPDALNPCEDVLSHGFLRVLVWLVSPLAITANLLVMFILLTSRQKFSVTRFLMGHLAFADFCMGIYLLLVASVDLYTRSHYHHYAIAWQTGGGCDLAGTLSVFASELSVYTLTLISLQRWHAIFYAMRPDRKLRLRHVAVLMLVGWTLCVILAMLPAVGVSSYQRVSICLPMDTETTAARAYVVSVLMVNVVAFMVVCLCYLHIYCMVHNPQHQSSRCDTSMAKRMAVLIFTNFLCLAPICFYGLSAALIQPLMTVTDSKVLLVLFYPLNSCAHPFFYAILTKAFHRDLLMLLSRMGLCQRQAHLYRSQLVSITPHIYRETMSALQSSPHIPKHLNTGIARLQDAPRLLLKFD